MKPREAYRITAVRVVEFHNLGTTTIEIPDGGHLFLLGDNGSGKTTVLDAIHLVLTGGREMEFNAATRDGESSKKEVATRKLLNEVITGSSSPGPLVAAMARLWDFGRLLVGSDFESLRRRIEASNAFRDDETAILRF